jgi:hypothetical protein
VSDAEWIVVVVQVLATIAAALSAWAAWRAANASRDAVRDQQAIAQEQRDEGFRSRLEELHEALTSVQTLAGSGDFVPVHMLQAAQAGVARQLSLLRAHVPAADAVAAAKLPQTQAAGQMTPVVLKVDLIEIRDLTIAAIVEVETFMQNI